MRCSDGPERDRSGSAFRNGWANGTAFSAVSAPGFGRCFPVAFSMPCLSGSALGACPWAAQLSGINGKGSEMETVRSWGRTCSGTVAAGGGDSFGGGHDRGGMNFNRPWQRVQEGSTTGICLGLVCRSKHQAQFTLVKQTVFRQAAGKALAFGANDWHTFASPVH